MNSVADKKYEIAIELSFCEKGGESMDEWFFAIKGNFYGVHWTKIKKNHFFVDSLIPNRLNVEADKYTSFWIFMNNRSLVVMTTTIIITDTTHVGAGCWA